MARLDQTHAMAAKLVWHTCHFLSEMNRTRLYSALMGAIETRRADAQRGDPVHALRAFASIALTLGSALPQQSASVAAALKTGFEPTEPPAIGLPAVGIYAQVLWVLASTVIEQGARGELDWRESSQTLQSSIDALVKICVEDAARAKMRFGAGARCVL